MTNLDLRNLLAEHLSDDLRLDPEGETTHAQRAKYLLDRLPLLGSSLDSETLRDLQTIASAVDRIGTRANQRARGD